MSDDKMLTAEAAMPTAVPSAEKIPIGVLSWFDVLQITSRNIVLPKALYADYSIVV